MQLVSNAVQRRRPGREGVLSMDAQDSQVHREGAGQLAPGLTSDRTVAPAFAFALFKSTWC